MNFKLIIVNKKILRKFVKIINYYLFANLFILFIIYTLYLFYDTQTLEYIIISIFASIILLLIIYYVLLLMPTKKGEIVINNNQAIINNKYFALSDLCIDLNIIDLNKEKDYISEIDEKYDKINRFGNYVINKETKEKFEIKLPEKRKLIYLLQEMNFCYSERDLLVDGSPYELLQGLMELTWGLFNP